MEYFWRIPFTISFLAILTFSFFSGGAWLVVAMWSWVGFLFWVITECKFNLFKMMLFWFPAIWIDRLAHWVSGIKE